MFSLECFFALDESKFEKSIWEALDTKVPAGKIVSYGKLAELANSSLGEGEGKRFARAVGSIMRKNCCSLVRPCHRVVPAPTYAQYLVAKTSRDSLAFGTYGGKPNNDRKRQLLLFELNQEDK